MALPLFPSLSSIDIFSVVSRGFVKQSISMNPKWAEENLLTIRTLMERSALYRRALAPILLLAGVIGLVTMAAGLYFHLDSTKQFCALWLGAASAAITGALLLARRQALKDQEPFWSSPTRRVVQALAPPLAAGMLLGILLALRRDDLAPTVSFVWLLFYGCALHAAGFFMPRPIRRLGLLFVLSSFGFFITYGVIWKTADPNAHYVMGIFFGAIHLAGGTYLYLTENGKNAA